jgi:Fe-S cluster assembly protein SufD
MNIKEKILSEIEKNTKNILGIFAFEDEYLKIFNKMNTISKDFENFKIYPDEIFEDFKYEIYTEEYNPNIEINTEHLINKIPDNCNVIFSINGYFSKECVKIISKNLNVVDIASIVNTDYYKVEKQLLNFYRENEDQFSILNSLLARDGVYINIAPNTIINEPIYIINIITELNKNYFINSHKLIKVDTNSFANIIEINLVYSKFDTICSELFLLHLEENANIKYSKIHFGNKLPNNKISYIENCNYKIDKNANLDINTINLGTSFNKNDISVKLESNNSNINHSFFAITTEDKIIDLKTKIFHNAPNSQSNQLIKVIANDTSQIYFDGKIIIENGAENSTATQISKAILMSDDAKVQFQPQLEIYNEDVKATHGSAVGNLDDNLLFYLKSRVIDNDIEKKTLLMAFAIDIINQSMAFDYLKDYAISEIIENVG